MRSSIDEVSPAGQCRRKSYDRAIERYNEDLRVRVEGFCDVEVAADEVPESGSVGIFVGWCSSWDRDICTSASSMLVGAEETGLGWPPTR